MSVSNEIVQVIVRFRPLQDAELSQPTLSCVELSESKVTIYPNNSNSLTFTFDKVLSALSTQEEMYQSGPCSIVSSVMQGFNGTIFTYGPNNSGKTYTMFGDYQDNEKKGVIPRMINTIFNFIDSADESQEFLIKVSFFELYNEKIFDLLNPLGNNLKLKNRKKGVSIEGLREVYTTCEFDIFELVKVGMANKVAREEKGITKFELAHCFFVINVEQQHADGGFRVGKLHMVDLAGANIENTSKQSEQIKSINTSLSSLGIVINALSEKSPSHIPYRASKLTRILEESLGGNSKTILIITCSASPLCLEETLSSLRFATRVKSVKNFPVVNRECSIHELKQKFMNTLEALRQASHRLEYLLNQDNSPIRHTRQSSIYDESAKDSVDYTEIKEELNEIQKRISQQESVKDKLEIEIETSKNVLNDLRVTENKQKLLLSELESASGKLENEIKEVETNLESVLTSVESLNTEYEVETQEIQDLESKLANTFAEVEHLKCKLKCLTEMRSSVSKAAVEEQLRRRIREEKEKNKQQKEEIKKAQYEIDLLLFKRYKDYIEADNLQVAGKKIFDLELEIDKARLKYLEDEQKLNAEQKQAKVQRDAFNKTLDRLSKDYRNLTAKHAEVLLEKLIFHKKSSRLEEKVQKLLSDIVKVDKRLASIEKFNGNTSQANELGKMLQRSGSLHSSLAVRRLQYSINGGV